MNFFLQVDPDQTWGAPVGLGFKRLFHACGERAPFRALANEEVALLELAVTDRLEFVVREFGSNAPWRPASGTVHCANCATAQAGDTRCLDLGTGHVTPPLEVPDSASHRESLTAGRRG